MIVRRVGPLSFGKLMGVLYALIGLIFGGLVSVISIVGGAFVPRDDTSGMFGALFGAAAIILLPIFYGVLGFVTSLIGAALYNVVAAAIGGVEIEVQ
ncbi:MAG: hypothetical protein ACRD1U_09275 [Vicinamibacterales bacterium]